MELCLTPQEQQFYGEVFNYCDVDKTGYVDGGKASEVFLSSGLNSDVLSWITDQCGARRLGHFGRSQFYIALRLIAASQNSVPFEALSTNSDLPLPKFDVSFESDPKHRNPKPPALSSPNTAARHGHLPPPPSKQSLRQQKGAHVNFIGAPTTTGGVGGTDALHNSHKLFASGQAPTAPELNNSSGARVETNGRPPKQQQQQENGFPPAATTTGTTSASSVASGPQTPPVDGEGWASFDDLDNTGLIDEEATKPPSSYQPGGVGGSRPGRPASSTSSSASETEPDDAGDDVWTISEEQRGYYTEQFLTMQPDLQGLISGAVAKEFFEKSKLAVSELSKIWELSDVDKDGCLSQQEFCTAMHMVVLRKHSIELPDHLPASLLPYSPLLPDAAVEEPQTSPERRPASPAQPTAQPSSSVGGGAAAGDQNSSPDQRPVRFEFEPPRDGDPLVLHPIAVKAGQPTSRQRRLSDPPSPSSRAPTLTTRPPADDTKHEDGTAAAVVTAPTARYVPVGGGLTAAGASAAAGGGGVRRLNQSTAAALARVTFDDATPPTPPPRSRTVAHSRSSSLDLSRLISISSAAMAAPSSASSGGIGAGGAAARAGGGAAPAVPPRRDRLSDKSDSIEEAVSAVTNPSAFSHVRPETVDELRESVRHQRQLNAILLRTSEELNQELQSAMEQRIALEIQLEHLRPFYT